MPTPTFAESQLTRIEQALAKNPGVRSISVDGVNVTFDDLIKQRDYWRRQVQAEQGNRSRVLSVELGFQCPLRWAGCWDSSITGVVQILYTSSPGSKVRNPSKCKDLPSVCESNWPCREKSRPDSHPGNLRRISRSDFH